MAGSRIVVIALTADASLDNAITLAQFAQRAGADVIKLALPYPYTPPEPVILSYFRKLADAVELPFIVESSDELEIPLTLIEVLCEHPRFAGLEELGQTSVASTNSIAGFGTPRHSPERRAGAAIPLSVRHTGPGRRRMQLRSGIHA